MDEMGADNKPTVIVGGLIVLNCPAYGIPQPNITWYSNGRPLLPTNRVRYGDKSGTKGCARGKGAARYKPQLNLILNDVEDMPE